MQVLQNKLVQLGNTLIMLTENCTRKCTINKINLISSSLFIQVSQFMNSNTILLKPDCKLIMHSQPVSQVIITHKTTHLCPWLEKAVTVMLPNHDKWHPVWLLPVLLLALFLLNILQPYTYKHTINMKCILIRLY